MVGVCLPARVRDHTEETYHDDDGAERRRQSPQRGKFQASKTSKTRPFELAIRTDDLSLLVLFVPHSKE
jgi:hypothetical protein